MRKSILASIICAACFASCLPFDYNQHVGHIPSSMSEDGTTFLVEGEPFTMLAGELHNSSTGSVHMQEGLWERMAAMNLNTVFAAASWELVEPVEGQFDFSTVDAMIDGARKNNLKLVILWFGSWKNGTSTYAPGWVKNNQERFPLACYKDGQKMNTLSTLSEESMKADANAFRAMMKHIREYDREKAVIAVQVENEIGTLDMMSTYMGLENRAMRDYSEAANEAFEGNVPEKLTSYLIIHKDEIHAAIDSAWNCSSYAATGTWEDVFGPGNPSTGTEDWQNEYPYITEEIFNAWNYATYVNYIAAAGKEEYNIPMYVNAWMKQSSQREPGKYPSGGPQAHLLDIWRAAAPSIDFISPDIYAIDIFDWICETYTQKGNPLIIPETKFDYAGAARAFYAIGKYGAQGYSPFGCDGGPSAMDAGDGDIPYSEAFGVLKNITPYINRYRGTEDMAGLYAEGDDFSKASVKFGDYTVSLGRLSYAASQAMLGVSFGEAKKESDEVGAIVFNLGDGEFLIGGYGPASVSVSLDRSLGVQTGIEYVDEVTFSASGRMLKHRLNGDETSFAQASLSKDKAKVFHIKLYKY